MGYGGGAWRRTSSFFEFVRDGMLLFCGFDREKNEWISVFSENEKTMAFCNEMSKAKTFATPNEAKEELEQMQKTGYFTDLSVYLLEDGNAYIAGERDSYQPIV
jgi:hypothetical protein